MGSALAVLLVLVVYWEQLIDSLSLHIDLIFSVLGISIGSFTGAGGLLGASGQGWSGLRPWSYQFSKPSEPILNST